MEILEPTGERVVSLMSVMMCHASRKPLLACMAIAASCLAIAMISCTLATCPGSASAPNMAFATLPISSKSRVQVASLVQARPLLLGRVEPFLERVDLLREC